MDRPINAKCPVIYIHDVTRVEFDAKPSVFPPQGEHDKGFHTRHLRVYDNSGFCVLDINMFGSGEMALQKTSPVPRYEPTKQETGDAD